MAMSCFWVMSREDQAYADYLGYATFCLVPEDVRALHLNHKIGADRLWRSIFGRRGELVTKRLIENGGRRTCICYELTTYEEALKKKKDPDIIFDELPLQCKASDLYRNFYVRENQIVFDQIFIHLSLVRFPLCELIGWVWGFQLLRAEKRDDGAPGRFLSKDDPCVRDFMELLWHPDKIRRERASIQQRKMELIR